MNARDPRIAIWLLAASPLVFLPGGMVRFVFPKLVLVALAIGFGALVARGGRVPRPVLAIMATGTLVFVVAALMSGTPLPSLLGRWPRYEGLPVLALYAGSAWLGAHLLGGEERAHRGRELQRAVAALAVVLGAFSALEALGWSVTGASDLTRTGSVLGNATDQGLVAMMAVALLIGPAFTTRSWFCIGGLGFGLLTVALSGSRAAMLATLLVFGVHLSAGRFAAPKPIAVGVAVLGALALVVPQARDRLTNLDTVTGRSVLWDGTARLVGDHPWLGVGPSRFVDAIGPYEDSAWIDRVGVDLAPDSPHSWPLQAMSAGGVPLLVCALALACLVLVLGWRSVRTHRDDLSVGLLAASIGYGSALLVNFTIAGSTCFAAFLVGGLVARPPRDDSVRRWQRPAIVATAAVALVGAVAASVAEIDLQKGVVSAGRGDVDTSDRAFARASHWRPLDSDIAMIASKALAGAANAGHQDAVGPTTRWARRSLGRTPETYDSGLALAVVQMAEDDLAAAKDRLDDLIRRFPVTHGAYVQRGIVRFGQRDVDGARSDLRRARRLKPKDPVPARLLAEIDRRVG